MHPSKVRIPRRSALTYKMNPEVEKILSPIKLVFENGDTEMYDDGRQLARAVFDKHYNISSYEVKDNSIEIRVYEFYEVNKNR